MSDNVVRAGDVGRAVWLGKRLLVVLALVGAGIGALAWQLLPATFTSSSKVLLEGAASEEDVATAAEIAMGRVVVDRAVDRLGWAPSTVDDDAVSAEAAQGSVVTIEAEAGSPTQAQALANQVTTAYISFSAEVADRAAHAAAKALSGRREDLSRQVEELDQAIGADAGALTDSEADASPQAALRTRRTELLQALNDIEQQVADARAEAAVGRASIRTIEAANVPSGPTTPSLLQMIGGGALLAPATGALALIGGRLADRKLRTRSEIASALGAPVLGNVAAEPGSGPQAHRPRSPLRWLLTTRDTARASLSQAEQRLENLRCRRVLHRLRGIADGPLKITVVAADDDDAAFRAAARLAAAADPHGRNASVHSDNPALLAAFEAGNGERATAEVPVTIAREQATDDGGATSLRIVAVPSARPTVSNNAGASGALVVVSAGSRTSWELFAIAEACRDAMLPILGALVVVPAGEEEQLESGVQPPVAEPVVPSGPRMNGHSKGVRI